MESNSRKFHWYRQSIAVEKIMCNDETGTFKEKRIAFKNSKSEYALAVFWGQKFIQEKQAILGNSFKYKKVSCIISFTNCAYIAITNIAYKKNRTILV